MHNPSTDITAAITPDVHPRPLGKFNYITWNGQLGASREYSDIAVFESEIRHASKYGIRASVVLYLYPDNSIEDKTQHLRNLLSQLNPLLLGGYTEVQINA